MVRPKKRSVFAFLVIGSCIFFIITIEKTPNIFNLAEPQHAYDYRNVVHLLKTEGKTHSQLSGMNATSKVSAAVWKTRVVSPEIVTAVGRKNKDGDVRPSSSSRSVNNVNNIVHNFPGLRRNYASHPRPIDCRKLIEGDTEEQRRAATWQKQNPKVISENV